MGTDPPLLVPTCARTGKKLDSENTYRKDREETLQHGRMNLFDEGRRFRAIGNESIHGLLCAFPKLVNDMEDYSARNPTH
ncbi:hypothetical protein Tco_0592972 [Tanacetum coccineum]